MTLRWTWIQKAIANKDIKEKLEYLERDRDRERDRETVRRRYREREDKSFCKKCLIIFGWFYCSKLTQVLYQILNTVCSVPSKCCDPHDTGSEMVKQ